MALSHEGLGMCWFKKRPGSRACNRASSWLFNLRVSDPSLETSEHHEVVGKDQLKSYLVKSYAKEDDYYGNEEEEGNDDDNADDDYDEERRNPSSPTSLLLSPLVAECYSR